MVSLIFLCKNGNSWKTGTFCTQVGNDGKLIFPDLIKEYSGDVSESFGFHVEESASHPLPSARGVPQVDSFSTLLTLISSVDYDGINAIPVR